MNMKLKQTWIFDTDIVKRTLMLVIWNASMIPFFFIPTGQMAQMAHSHSQMWVTQASISKWRLVWVSYSHANITHSDFHNKGFYA